MDTKKKKTSTDNWLEQYDSDEWKERRKQILKLDGNECQSCGRDEELHVHHSFYEKGRAIHDYNDGELITLCEDCHKHMHLLKTELNRVYIPLLTTGCRDGNFFDYEEFCEVAHLMAMQTKDSRFGSLLLTALAILEDKNESV